MGRMGDEFSEADNIFRRGRREEFGVTSQPASAYPTLSLPTLR